MKNTFIIICLFITSSCAGIMWTEEGFLKQADKILGMRQEQVVSMLGVPNKAITIKDKTFFVYYVSSTANISTPTYSKTYTNYYPATNQAISTSVTTGGNTISLDFGCEITFIFKGDIAFDYTYQGNWCTTPENDNATYVNPLFKNLYNN